MNFASVRFAAIATVLCILAGSFHSPVEAGSFKKVLGLGLLGAAIAPRFVPVPIPDYSGQPGPGINIGGLGGFGGGFGGGF